MTAQQIKWASQHDWFVSADRDLVTVRDEWVSIDDGKLHMELRTFRDFGGLRFWAGY